MSKDSVSKFIKFNNTDIQQKDENGNPINGTVVYAEDYDRGVVTVLRFIDGYLDGDLFDSNGNFLMQKPAVDSEGHQEYWRKNKLHRDNEEPAVYSDGFTTLEYWQNGKRIEK